MDNSKTVVIWHAQNRMYYVYQNTNIPDAFERFAKEFGYRPNMNYVDAKNKDADYFAIPSEP